MNEEREICFKPIGTIHSPFKKRKGMPIQPAGAKNVKGTVEVFSEYEEGLADLSGFSHIVLLYHFHMSSGYSLQVVPFLDDTERGLFSTRAPRRPNGIGLSVVELLAVEGTTLHIQGVDILDGTPLLDIKPYVPVFDTPPNIRCGWLEKKAEDASRTNSDSRFTGT